MDVLSPQVSSFQAEHIIAADWGIAMPLTTLHMGNLPLREEAFSLLPEKPSEPQEADVHDAFALRNAIWIAHTAGNETFLGVNARLEKMAAEAGHHKVHITAVMDHNGRPIFDVFRMMPGAEAAAKTP